MLQKPIYDAATLLAQSQIQLCCIRKLEYNKLWMQ